MEVHDLVLAKLAAGRSRDMEFAAETIRHGLADPLELEHRAADLPLDDQHRAHVLTLLQSAVAKAAAQPT
jgi:hypothetical protein